MAGRYVELNASQGGYLARWAAQGLNPDRRAAAEREADRLVDNVFEKWDRTLWQGDAVPTEVAEAAEKYAAGEYLMRAGALSGAGDPSNSTGAILKREARKAMEEVVERGGPIDAMGRRIAKKDDGQDDAGLFVEVVR